MNPTPIIEHAPLTVAEAVALLAQADRKLNADLMIRIFADGSGSIRVAPGGATDKPLLEFDNLPQLQTWLLQYANPVDPKPAPALFPVHAIRPWCTPCFNGVHQNCTDTPLGPCECPCQGQPPFPHGDDAT